MRKGTFVLAMVCALAAVLATGGLLASNMGFKVNRTLNGAGAGGALVGENHISLPFNPQLGLSNADNLLGDIELGDTTLVDFVQRFDPTTNQRETWFGGKIGGVNFSLVACESYFVTVAAARTTDYIIVGSHNPTLPCTFNGTGIAGWVVNENTYAIPYHTTATNASDLLGQIPNASFVQRFDPAADQRDSWFGAKIGGTNFSISPGEGYFIQMNAGQTASVTPEHF
jgi:hypothetical protein